LGGTLIATWNDAKALRATAGERISRGFQPRSGATMPPYGSGRWSSE
jgi:hypothetical protein